jgi:NADH-quinone oxidoreductase subunit E
VATFYAQFSYKPRGKHIVCVCRGTACHVRGAKRILATAKKVLGIPEGETTPDFRFTLETVACLGTCFLSPTMMIDKRFYGQLTPEKVGAVIKSFR